MELHLRSRLESLCCIVMVKIQRVRTQALFKGRHVKELWGHVLKLTQTETIRMVEKGIRKER